MHTLLNALASLAQTTAHGSDVAFGRADVALVTIANLSGAR